MKLMNQSPLCGALVAAAGLSLATPPAEAFIYTEDFESANVGDALNDIGWNEIRPGLDVNSPSYITPATNAVQSRVGEGQSRAAIYEGPSNDGFASSDWADYTINVTLGIESWSETTSNWIGMGARAREISDGVYAMFGFRVRGSTGLEIIHIQGTSATGLGPIVSLGATSIPVGAIESGSIMNATFSIVNNDETEEVQMAIDLNTGTQVLSATASISFEDAGQLVNPGSIAIWSSESSSASRGFSWDNINVTGTPIPEPASLGLLSLASLLVTCRQRTRRS